LVLQLDTFDHTLYIRRAKDFLGLLAGLIESGTEFIKLFTAERETCGRPKQRGRNKERNFLDADIGKIIEGLSDTPSAANHAFTAARTFFRWVAKPPRRYIPYRI
jgi:hypothetical protein